MNIPSRPFTYSATTQKHTRPSFNTNWIIKAISKATTCERTINLSNSSAFPHLHLPFPAPDNHLLILGLPLRPGVWLLVGEMERGREENRPVTLVWILIFYFTAPKIHSCVMRWSPWALVVTHWSYQVWLRQHLVFSS